MVSRWWCHRARPPWRRRIRPAPRRPSRSASAARRPISSRRSTASGRRRRRRSWPTGPSTAAFVRLTTSPRSRGSGRRARRDQAARSALRAAARGAVGLAARHPRHAVLSALVAGMLAPGHPAALLLVVLAAPRRPWLALGLLAAALGGAWLAHARTAQLDRTALTPLLGHRISERVVLLAVPGETSFGGWQATVALRGERVALTAGRWVPRPAVEIGAQLGVAGTLKALS